MTLGLWSALGADEGIAVAGVDIAFDELVLLATEPRAPGVVLLDAARVQAGPLRRVNELAPHIGIVVLVESSRDSSPSSLRDEGAAECLPLDAKPAELCAAVYRAAEATRCVARPASEQRRRRLDARALERLTQRQREVLALLSEGHTRSTIALLLGVKESTIGTHVKKIYKVLGVSHRAEVRGLEVPTGHLCQQ